MKAVDKHANKVLINLILAEFFKKKKEPFYNGYRNPWYFRTNPMKIGGKNEV